MTKLKLFEIRLRFLLWNFPEVFDISNKYTLVTIEEGLLRPIVLINEDSLKEPYKTKCQNPIYRIRFTIFLTEYIKDSLNMDVEVGYL